MGRDSEVDRLAALGADQGEIEELLAYTETRFDLEATRAALSLPLPDELFVACWRGWAEEARDRGVWATLRDHLPQLRFPIHAGISESDDYRAATRRGVAVDELPEAPGLVLERPERLRLEIHPTPAGRIPLLITGERADFVALVRALARRNEPAPVPESMGALAVAGYNNWERIHPLRQAWEQQAPAEREHPTWAEAFGHLRERRELYQDRFILLSDGPYSDVPAAEMGLEEAAWRELSLIIRREHECVHYFTRRVLGSMRNHLHDELIADDAGMTAVTGRFRADWFLRFLGVDGCAESARLEIYRGTPPLSDGAWKVAQKLVAQTAHNLERFDLEHPGEQKPLERALRIAALATVGLGGLAAADGGERLGRVIAELRGRWSRGDDG